MDKLSKIIGALGPDDGARNVRPVSMADGAIDTLSSVIRIMGDESFPLDSDNDPDAFPLTCAELARHIENGASVPSFDIQASSDGRRSRPRLRASQANLLGE